jgi:hypothetical protein
LPEYLPLTKDSVTGSYISSPEFADRYGGLGRFSTTNYSYGFGRGKRLAYITRLPKDKSGRSLYDRFKPWAIDPSQVNTNAAYLLATQFLAEAFVDLSRLSTSAVVSIHPKVILKMTTSVYDLEWKRGGKNAVEIGLDESTKELWLLRVEDPSLVLRKPLEITNLDFLLSQTNAPAQTNVPVRGGASLHSSGRESGHSFFCES